MSQVLSIIFNIIYLFYRFPTIFTITNTSMVFYCAENLVEISCQIKSPPHSPALAKEWEVTCLTN